MPRRLRVSGEVREVFVKDLQLNYSFSGKDVDGEPQLAVVSAIPFNEFMNQLGKVEEKKLVKVVEYSGRLIPLTTAGAKLAQAYSRVGFSYIPVIVVPLKKEEEEE